MQKHILCDFFPALTSIRRAHQISNTNVKTALLLSHSYPKVDVALEIVTLTSRNTHSHELPLHASKTNGDEKLDSTEQEKLLFNSQ